MLIKSISKRATLCWSDKKLVVNRSSNQFLLNCSDRKTQNFEVVQSILNMLLLLKNIYSQYAKFSYEDLGTIEKLKTKIVINKYTLRSSLGGQAFCRLTNTGVHRGCCILVVRQWQRSKVDEKQKAFWNNKNN